MKFSAISPLLLCHSFGTCDGRIGNFTLPTKRDEDGSRVDMGSSYMTKEQRTKGEEGVATELLPLDDNTLKDNNYTDGEISNNLFEGDIVPDYDFIMENYGSDVLEELEAEGLIEKPLRNLQVSRRLPPHLISLSGENKACRGGNSGDNSGFYYALYHLAPNNIDECFKRCYYGPICYGVEYKKSSGRCEVWNRMPRATANANGYECYINPDLKPNSDLISLRGENKACRGDNSRDNSASYYSLYHVAPNNIDECFKLCYDRPICYGVEYKKSSGRCEVWNGMPIASANANGYECYINPNPDVKPHPDFKPFNGVNKACRGDNIRDNSASYYSLYHVAPNNIDECFERCYNSFTCHGIEYNKSSGRCEVWNRIPLATANVNGYECYLLFNPDLKPNPDLKSFKGENKACRGDNIRDNSASYYSLYYVDDNIDECLKLCYDGSICYGVEYEKSSGRCEVWNRMPLATANVNGYECYVK